MQMLPELPVLRAPEAVSKTSKSVTLRIDTSQLPDTKGYKFQVSHSEHGYVYYSWTESELFGSRNCPVKHLTPNTNYVFRARVVLEESKECSEWSVPSTYIRTFTDEEDAKRSGTVFEHALRMEREQKNQLQSQISKLTNMLETNNESAQQNVKYTEDMMSSRRVIDTKLHKLQQELSDKTSALNSIKSQRELDEQMITDLLNEQETLRQQTQENRYESEVNQLKEQLEKNEEQLRQRQEQAKASTTRMEDYELSLQKTQQEIKQKEDEVEKLMADCDRILQEQADAAKSKQLEVEEALMEAKTSLEQQLDINTYLRDEVSRLREENHHLKNQIQEMDEEIAPRLVELEDENERLKQQLGRR